MEIDGSLYSGDIEVQIAIDARRRTNHRSMLQLYLLCFSLAPHQNGHGKGLQLQKECKNWVLAVVAKLLFIDISRVHVLTIPACKRKGEREREGERETSRDGITVNALIWEGKLPPWHQRGCGWNCSPSQRITNHTSQAMPEQNPSKLI